MEITEPGESEDVGHDWEDPRALREFGDREPTEPWSWSGPARSVTGRTWGGCIEVVQWVLAAGRFPSDPSVLDGGVLVLESSEELIPAREFGWILRALGEPGALGRRRRRRRRAAADIGLRDQTRSARAAGPA